MKTDEFKMSQRPQPKEIHQTLPMLLKIIFSSLTRALQRVISSRDSIPQVQNLVHSM